MASGTSTVPGLSFPRETFAQLTPGPFLLAHLKQQQPVRPSGRTPSDFRPPTVSTNSLSHSNGSAVVRVGDTAVVCGIRAEILLASDVPNPSKSASSSGDLIEDLGLLVPNLELSTGCSPAHLPGNPPGSLAQSLSYRILSLLRSSRILHAEDLCIKHTDELSDDDDDIDATGGILARAKTTTKAYWTLYIDILCIALDGNAFDAAWAAVIAALRNTRLPRASWLPDQEVVSCSPLSSEAVQLQIGGQRGAKTLVGVPMASSFAVFSTDSPLKDPKTAESFILADPDGFEETVCDEKLTVALVAQDGSPSSIVNLEKSGGSVIGRELMQWCISLAEKRWKEWDLALRAG